MGLLFAGGEDSCFTIVGSYLADTTASYRRTAMCRNAIRLYGNGPNDGMFAEFASQSSFWFTARLLLTNASQDAGKDIFSFRDSSGVSRIAVRASTSTIGNIELIKRNAAGTVTVLASATGAHANSAIYKLDAQVNYGTSGSVQFYIDGILKLSYTGDVTTDGVTSLSGFRLAVNSDSSAAYGVWSEVIVHTDDTRSMSLVTLEPSANGNAFTFDSGSYASVDEGALDDLDVVASGTANQVAQFAVNNTRVTGNVSVKGVAVWARAQRGASGPQNMQIGVRSGGADHWSSNKALALSMANVQHVLDTNPATSAAWASSDLTAAGFNIGVKSIA